MNVENASPQTLPPTYPSGESRETEWAPENLGDVLAAVREKAAKKAQLWAQREEVWRANLLRARSLRQHFESMEKMAEEMLGELQSASPITGLNP